MKKLLLVLGVIACATIAAQAGDLYRIFNPNSLVTARRSDLVTFMYLNRIHNKPAVRALYNSLAYQRLLVNFQPGAIVEVTSYYGDGTAQITGQRLIGYIATDDLTQYLGSTRRPGFESAPDTDDLQVQLD